MSKESRKHGSTRIETTMKYLEELMGAEKVILKASQVEALDLLKSENIEDQVLAFQRIIWEDPSIKERPSLGEIEKALKEIEEEITIRLAQRQVEKSFEQKVDELVQKRQKEFMAELKKELLQKEEGADNARTLKKYAELEILEARSLSAAPLEILRPGSLQEIIGQEEALEALLAKIASPFPQHVILFGPPGVGKTTAARLVLEEAKNLPYTPFSSEARFVEVDGTTLRWDPREATNPLLGSVHDPIYQGAQSNLAERGMPEPKTGLVTRAHGGVLFIDEIGEMDSLLQNKLLKVLEDKRVKFESSYYDPGDKKLPKYIRKLFAEGAPADFTLIGATTREPHELSPSLLSRTAQVFFRPLSPEAIERIVMDAARRLGVNLAQSIPSLISRYTVEGRRAAGLLADAYSLALFQAYREGEKPEDITITQEHIRRVIHISRLVPYHTEDKPGRGEVGRVRALGLRGYLGSIIEIEAVVFPARNKGEGEMKFNQTAGSMTLDALLNAGSVLRKVAGHDVRDYDLHVNLVGGGNVDGPSAGAALFLAIFSAIEDRPLPQDTAITGELSIQGRIKPVGGLLEKIYGVRNAGIKKVYIPGANKADLPENISHVEVIPVHTIEELVEYIFA